MSIMDELSTVGGIFGSALSQLPVVGALGDYLVQRRQADLWGGIGDQQGLLDQHTGPQGRVDIQGLAGGLLQTPGMQDFGRLLMQQNLQQDFRAGQNELTREWQGQQNQIQRDFQANQYSLDRAQRDKNAHLNRQNQWNMMLQREALARSAPMTVKDQAALLPEINRSAKILEAQERGLQAVDQLITALRPGGSGLDWIASLDRGQKRALMESVAEGIGRTRNPTDTELSVQALEAGIANIPGGMDAFEGDISGLAGRKQQEILGALMQIQKDMLFSFRDRIEHVQTYGRLPGAGIVQRRVGEITQGSDSYMTESERAAARRRQITGQ